MLLFSCVWRNTRPITGKKLDHAEIIAIIHFVVPEVSLAGDSESSSCEESACLW